jgi:hypothetical protein
MTNGGCPRWGGKHVHLEQLAADGEWSQKYRGPIRYESAKLIAQLVRELTEYTDPSDIIVLTPFRAQRALVRTFLRRSGVSVSTVHRAQGSECHTVIFDPVQGNNNFLKTEDAPRLVNVALSRAKVRLVVILSAGDRRNQLFDRVSNLIESVSTRQSAIPVSLLATQLDFPFCAMNKVVEIKNSSGRVTAGRVANVINNGERFRLIDFGTGGQRTYVTAIVVKTYGQQVMVSNASVSPMSGLIASKLQFAPAFVST